jgi:hypothetical protein
MTTASTAHPLYGLWLIHYYESDPPWRTICDLPDEAAGRIAEQTGKRAVDYMRDCRAVEHWDRGQHMKRGGIITADNPVYAILCPTENPAWHRKRGKRLSLPAHSVPADAISISLGESFPNYYRWRAEGGIPTGLLGRTYSAQDFARLLETGLFPDAWPAGYDGPTPFYVEARLYCRQNAWLCAQIQLTDRANCPKQFLDEAISSGLMFRATIPRIRPTDFSGP